MLTIVVCKQRSRRPRGHEAINPALGFCLSIFSKQKQGRELYFKQVVKKTQTLRKTFLITLLCERLRPQATSFVASRFRPKCNYVSHKAENMFLRGHTVPRQEKQQNSFDLKFS